MTARGGATSPGTPTRRGLWTLALLAFGSRLWWALAGHPPGTAVFSDMQGYVSRGRLLATEGAWLATGTPTLFPPGTHWLIAAAWPLGELHASAVVWAVLGGLAPVLGWLLAEQVGSERWMGPALGWMLLVWPPHVSHGGYLLSETPFLTLVLAATLGLAQLAQTGRGALWTGLALGAAFLVRPQVAVFAALGALVTRMRQPLRLLAPIACAAATCVALHHAATGTWAVAGNASLNRALALCAAPRVEFVDEETGAVRYWLEPPAFGERVRTVPASHPLAVRPALGAGVVQTQGSVTRTEAHHALKRRCSATLSAGERGRALVVRAALLWLGEAPWPEASDPSAPTLSAVRASHRLARWLVLPLALLGLTAALRRGRDAPEALLAPAQIVSLVGIAAWYFGSLRLRVWADPYLLLLACEGCALLLRLRSAGARGSVRAPGG